MGFKRTKPKEPKPMAVPFESRTGLYTRGNFQLNQVLFKRDFKSSNPPIKNVRYNIFVQLTEFSITVIMCPDAKHYNAWNCTEPIVSNYLSMNGPNGLTDDWGLKYAEPTEKEKAKLEHYEHD